VKLAAILMEEEMKQIMDGIKGDIEKSQGTAGTFFVLGTNYEHRAISEKEFYGFIDQMKEYMKQIVIGDYLLIYDDRNALAVADDKYLVGSVLLAKMGERGEVFCRMSEDDMEGFTLHTEGTDIWDVMSPSNLRKLEAIVSQEVEVSSWQRSLTDAKTLDAVQDLRFGLMETENSVMTTDQIHGIMNAICEKEESLSMAESKEENKEEKKPSVKKKLQKKKEATEKKVKAPAKKPKVKEEACV